MLRPNDCEREFERDAAPHGWTEIALTSPLGLVMVAILAAGSLAAMAPSIVAETAIVAATPFERHNAVIPTHRPRSLNAPRSARSAGSAPAD
jgi:hypothetical protein